MHTESVEHWMHDHTFAQDSRKSGERRTLIVIAITAVTMIVEIAAGFLFGSMALLADGLHMGSHASALTISAFAYYYTRRHAKDARFNFGTGKVNSLAAFASAVLLVVFALVMVWESIERFVAPVPIQFNQAIIVAVVGLAVNGLCLLILGGHGHSHGHRVASGSFSKATRRGDDHDENARATEHAHLDRHSDHNLWAAYVHVLADALTSVLAIGALLAGKYLGQGWLDPAMGILGALLITRWSLGLLRSSSRVLLDMQAPKRLLEGIRTAIEGRDDNKIADLHVWAVGPGIYAAEIAVVSASPRPPEQYWKLLPHDLDLVHVTVEVHRCRDVRTFGGPDRPGTSDAGSPEGRVG